MGSTSMTIFVMNLAFLTASHGHPRSVRFHSGKLSAGKRFGGVNSEAESSRKKRIGAQGADAFFTNHYSLTPDHCLHNAPPHPEQNLALAGFVF